MFGDVHPTRREIEDLAARDRGRRRREERSAARRTRRGGVDDDLIGLRNSAERRARMTGLTADLHTGLGSQAAGARDFAPRRIG